MNPTIRTTAEALAYWTERTETATNVAEQVVAGAGLQRNPRTPVLYAVWLGDQRDAAYIGQSLNGYRRLWDLAIGESHHLANTFPPEIWGSVAVIRWSDLLGEELHQLLQTIREHPACGLFDPNILAGLGFEHLFLERVRPLFNSYKRNRAGRLMPVALERSLGRGAKFAPICQPFSERLFVQWDALQDVGTSANDNFASRIILS